MTVSVRRNSQLQLAPTQQRAWRKSKCNPQFPSSHSIRSIYSTSGGCKCRELPIDQSWNRIQIQPAGACSWGSGVLCSEVILKTSAAGSNYARTTQCLAAFGKSNSQHKPFYSSLYVRHKGQGGCPHTAQFCIWQYVKLWKSTLKIFISDHEMQYSSSLNSSLKMHPCIAGGLFFIFNWYQYIFFYLLWWSFEPDSWLPKIKSKITMKMNRLIIRPFLGEKGINFSIMGLRIMYTLTGREKPFLYFTWMKSLCQTW